MATLEQLAALAPTYPATSGWLARLWWPGAAAVIAAIEAVQEWGAA